MPLKPSNPSAVVGDEDADEDEEDDEDNQEKDDDVHPANARPAANTATSRMDDERGRDRLIVILIEFLCIFPAYRRPTRCDRAASIWCQTQGADRVCKPRPV